MKSSKCQKVCLVTPEIDGLTDSSRIGSHCFFLAKFLAEKMSQEVTVLLTSDGCNAENLERWHKFYGDKWGIQVVCASELPPMFEGRTYQSHSGSFWFAQRSHKIYTWLRQQDFAACYFQEWQANGFISIQAKRTGQAFARTALICLLQGSSEWLRQERQQLPSLAEDDLLLDWTERYCVEFADAVISPTEQMLAYLEANDWKIRGRKEVLPHLFETDLKSIGGNFIGKDIIFFGSLQTLSGLELFLKSLRQLAPWLQETGRHIDLTFLDQNITNAKGDGVSIIGHFLAGLDSIYFLNIITDLSPAESLNFLRNRSEALVIVASALESLPYPLIASLELNLNVITANRPGSLEIFADDSRLFDFRPDYLADKIKECILTGLSPLRKKYSAEKARELWHQSYPNLTFVTESEAAAPSLPLPLVSVCIPYYNAGRYLPELLTSLTQQTYTNYEVIILDDGSTDGHSQQVFQEMQISYQHKNWQFLSQKNGGVGSARNSAARQAKGTYLIFMDADNVAEKEMIEKMVSAALASNLDCLTCYNRMFYEGENPFSAIYQHAYTPLGNCPEASLYINCFGDANLILKQAVFWSLGGFLESKLVTWEDWEFLTRLTLQGYQLDVIPDFLFLYRLRQDSMTQITSSYQNRLTATAPLLKTLPKWAQRFTINSLGSIEALKNEASYLHQQLQSQSQYSLTEIEGLHSRIKALESQLLQARNEAKQAKHKNAQLLQAKNEVKEAKAMIAAIETSKFWKLRNGWFRLKRFLRLPTDE